MASRIALGSASTRTRREFPRVRRAWCGGVHAYLCGERAIINMETGWFPATHGALYLGRASPTCQIPRRAFRRGYQNRTFSLRGCAREPHAAARHGARHATWKTSCGARSSSWCDVADESEGLRPLPQRLLHLLALHPRPRMRVHGCHAEAAVGGRLVAQDQLADERIHTARL